VLVAVEFIREIHHAFASIVEFQPDLVIMKIARLYDMPGCVLISGQLVPLFRDVDGSCQRARRESRPPENGARGCSRAPPEINVLLRIRGDWVERKVSTSFSTPVAQDPGRHGRRPLRYCCPRFPPYCRRAIAVASCLGGRGVMPIGGRRAALVLPPLLSRFPGHRMLLATPCGPHWRPKCPASCRRADRPVPPSIARGSGSSPADSAPAAG